MTKSLAVTSPIAVTSFLRDRGAAEAGTAGAADARTIQGAAVGRAADEAASASNPMMRADMTGAWSSDLLTRGHKVEGTKSFLPGVGSLQVSKASVFDVLP